VPSSLLNSSCKKKLKIFDLAKAAASYFSQQKDGKNETAADAHLRSCVDTLGKNGCLGLPKDKRGSIAPASIEKILEAGSTMLGRVHVNEHALLPTDAAIESLCNEGLLTHQPSKESTKKQNVGQESSLFVVSLQRTPATALLSALKKSGFNEGTLSQMLSTFPFPTPFFSMIQATQLS